MVTYPRENGETEGEITALFLENPRPDAFATKVIAFPRDHRSRLRGAGGVKYPGNGICREVRSLDYRTAQGAVLLKFRKATFFSLILLGTDPTPEQILDKLKEVAGENHGAELKF